MASEAVVIVRLRVPHQLAMRIVTTNATAAAIDPIEAFAFLQTIRLKPHIDLSGHTALHHVCETTMTLSAKSRYVFGLHASQLLRHGFRLALRDRLCMQTRRCMAMLALNAGRERIELNAIASHGPGRMAVETRPRFNVGDGTAHRLDNVVWMGFLIAQRYVQSIDGGIIADAALIKPAFVLQRVSLRLESEGPTDRYGKSARSIGHRIDILTVHLLDRISVRVVSEAQPPTGLHRRVGSGQQQRVRHRSLHLRVGLFRVA